MQPEQIKRRKWDRNSEDERCTKKKKNPHSNYQIPRSVATSNLFTALRDIPMENAGQSSERGFIVTSGASEDLNRGRTPPSF
jgi:hypothetical protein